MKSIRILFVVIIGLLLETTLSAQSQQSSGKQKTSESSTQSKQGMMGGKMMGRCQAMMEERQQMQAEMKAMEKGSMSQCPMMKRMSGEKGPQGEPKKSGADHSKHHQ